MKKQLTHQTLERTGIRVDPGIQIVGPRRYFFPRYYHQNNFTSVCLSSCVTVLNFQIPATVWPGLGHRNLGQRKLCRDGQFDKDCYCDRFGMGEDILCFLKENQGLFLENVGIDVGLAKKQLSTRGLSSEINFAAFLPGTTVQFKRMYKHLGLSLL